MSGFDVLPTSDQQALVDAVSRAVGQLFPITRLDHGRRPATIAAADWAKAAQMGWIGVALPVEAGGAGSELTDAVLAQRQLARQLVSPSLLATSLAAKIALSAGDGRVQALCAGELRAAFVMRASGPDGGADCYVLDPEGAALFVAMGPAGAQLVTVDLAAARMVEPLDSTVPLARAPMFVAEGRADPAAGLWAQALLASELAGLAQAAAEMAANYAKLREQFGKPIGAFQAIANMCADAAMRAEAATAQSNFAAICVQGGLPDAAFQAQAALLVAGDAAFRNATSNIQVHGGMGFAVECDAHLYLKRAVLLRALGRATPLQQAADEAARHAA